MARALPLPSPEGNTVAWSHGIALHHKLLTCEPGARTSTYFPFAPAAWQVVHDIEYGYVDPLRCKVSGAAPSPPCRWRPALHPWALWDAAHQQLGRPATCCCRCSRSSACASWMMRGPSRTAPLPPSRWGQGVWERHSVGGGATWAVAWCRRWRQPFAPVTYPPGLAQDVMVAYFSQRPGRLAQEGLVGLRASMAGIYHVPFLTGVSMHFRFAGQSIPNRIVFVCVVQGLGKGRTGAARCLDSLGLRMCISNGTKPAQQKQL